MCPEVLYKVVSLSVVSPEALPGYSCICPGIRCPVGCKGPCTSSSVFLSVALNHRLWRSTLPGAGCCSGCQTPWHAGGLSPQFRCSQASICVPCGYRKQWACNLPPTGSAGWDFVSSSVKLTFFWLLREQGLIPITYLHWNDSLEQSNWQQWWSRWMLV